MYPSLSMVDAVASQILKDYMSDRYEDVDMEVRYKFSIRI